MTRPNPPARESAVVFSGVTKRFGATLALSDVSFEIDGGAVHAVLGENGAGKSTLIKILSGLVQPDAGDLTVFGKSEGFSSRQASSGAGLETAFQEIPLVPDLTVADNLLLPDPPVRFGLIRDRGAARRRVEAILADLELSDIDPDLAVRELDLSVRQKIEIARAIARAPRILILDEPTAALSQADVAWLGRRIHALKAAGVTIILVTHRMQEVREFCGSLSILCNGAHVGSFATRDISDDEVFRLIMGRSIDVAFPAHLQPANREGAPALTVANLAAGHRLVDVSFDLWPGEIVGVAALQGMGQLELFNALFGVEAPSAGVIARDGQPVILASPRDAIDHGIGLTPEDRKIQGLALQLTGAENASLPAIDQLARFGWLDLARERALVDAEFARVGLAPRAVRMPAGAFSGGNQQKMVLAKWLLTRCKVLLALDPTRGVDVGTKHEIYRLLHAFTAAGGAVLLYSTELQELAGLASRTLVIYRGRIAASLPGSAPEDLIGAHMLGAEAAVA